MSYFKGDHIKSATHVDQQEWERDLALDYVIQSGPFSGVALGWRHSTLRSQLAPAQDLNRLVVSYTLALF